MTDHKIIKPLLSYAPTSELRVRKIEIIDGYPCIVEVTPYFHRNWLVPTGKITRNYVINKIEICRSRLEIIMLGDPESIDFYLEISFKVSGVTNTPRVAIDLLASITDLDLFISQNLSNFKEELLAYGLKKAKKNIENRLLYWLHEKGDIKRMANFLFNKNYFV